MERRLTRGSRMLAGALALAIACVSAATCFAAAAQMQGEQHAHCPGHDQDSDDDNTAAIQDDCCAVQSADLVRLPNGAQVVEQGASMVAPSLLAMTPYVAPIFTVDPGVPKPLSSPTYLLISVFRL